MASIATPRDSVNASRVAPCLFPGGTLAERRSQQADNEKLAVPASKAAGGPAESLYALWLFDDQLGWYIAPGDPKTLADWAEIEYCLDGVYSFVPVAACRDNVTLSHAGAAL